ncbi:predicted protein [Nematostella vectensis]|uniref:Amine oxidase domain-containing protein n=1 Tax=Nematostella vectensis TaxID=45351 RepID=A7SIC9_NEMVE|nr:predicted protein [Nematostella vectensis]|eukprot:XP_001628612.1 predicted protein [Nematostella vectensis]
MKPSGSFTVAVVGGGVAGLAAAASLIDKGFDVKLLEAADYFGGRVIQALPFPGFAPVDLGAEFIHGDRTILNDIARKQSWKVHRENLLDALVLEGSYSLLKDYYLEKCEKVDKKLNWQVKQVILEDDQSSSVILINQDGEPIHVDYVIITVPLSILKDGDIRFSPPLPFEKQQAIDSIKVGSALKIICRFRTRFWQKTFVVDLDGFIPQMWMYSRNHTQQGNQRTCNMAGPVQQGNQCPCIMTGPTQQGRQCPCNMTGLTQQRNQCPCNMTGPTQQWNQCPCIRAGPTQQGNQCPCNMTGPTQQGNQCPCNMTGPTQQGNQCPCVMTGPTQQGNQCPCIMAGPTQQGKQCPCNMAGPTQQWNQFPCNMAGPTQQGNQCHYNMADSTQHDEQCHVVVGFMTADKAASNIHLSSEEVCSRFLGQLDTIFGHVARFCSMGCAEMDIIFRMPKI